MTAPKRLSISDRFWPKVDRRSADECWIWQGARTGTAGSSDRYGYLGQTRATRFGPYVPARRAHVVSWEMHNGPVPTGMVVCHRCDVPLCVNPAHLFAAPQGENNADRKRKGRNANFRGERNPNCKVTEGQVEEIRQRFAAGERQIALAREYGIKQPHVSRLVHRQSRT